MILEQRKTIRCFGRNYDGVLFDMDGTLVDSRMVVERMWTRWANANGLNPAEILAVSHGRRTIDVVREFAPADMDVRDKVEKLEAQEIADIEGIVAVNGTREFVGQLTDGQWAVVTSAGRRLAIRRLSAAGLPIPAVVVTAEDVASGKPEPQGYTLAAELLGMSADRCIVFEDAPAGIEAGLRAGCDVVAIAAARPSPSKPTAPRCRILRALSSNSA